VLDARIRSKSAACGGGAYWREGGEVIVMRRGCFSRSLRIKVLELANVQVVARPKGSALVPHTVRGATLEFGPWDFNRRGGARAHALIDAAIVALGEQYDGSKPS